VLDLHDRPLAWSLRSFSVTSRLSSRDRLPPPLVLIVRIGAVAARCTPLDQHPQKVRQPATYISKRKTSSIARCDLLSTLLVAERDCATVTLRLVCPLTLAARCKVKGPKTIGRDKAGNRGRPVWVRVK
jgi:hypothetical protein